MDEKRRPVPGTEEYYSCDTLLLSVGLIPENELSKSAGVDLDQITGGPVVNDCLETSISGVFACGNVLHVHDLVDYVSEEAALAGRSAAAYAGSQKEEPASANVRIRAVNGVRYTVPQFVNRESEADQWKIRFRVSDVYRIVISVFIMEMNGFIIRRKRFSRLVRWSR